MVYTIHAHAVVGLGKIGPRCDQNESPLRCYWPKYCP